MVNIQMSFLSSPFGYATGNHHGHDFLRYGAVPNFAGDWAGGDHYLPQVGPVASAASLQLGYQSAV
jgi:hypothetical protein